MILENTFYREENKGKYYQKYVCVIIQYVTKINSEKVMTFLREL